MSAETETIPGLSHKHEHMIMVVGAVAGILGLLLLSRARSSAPASSAAASGQPQPASGTDFQSQLAGLIYDTQAINYDEFSAIAGKLGITNAALTTPPSTPQITQWNGISPGQSTNQTSAIWQVTYPAGTTPPDAAGTLNNYIASGGQPTPGTPH